MRLFSSTALIGALLVLLVLLASLQYYWLGEVSAGERERMQSLVDAGATRFGEDFDLEVARMYLTFQLDAQAVRTRQWQRYAQRYTHWMARAPYPKLLGNMYLVELYQNGRVNLSLYNPAAQTFAATQWPDSMADLHARFDQSLRATRVENGGLVGSTLDPIDEAVPALVIPVAHQDLLSNPQAAEIDVDLIFGATMFRRQSCPRCKGDDGPLLAYTVVTLDRGYMRDEFIPALTHKYFANNNTLDYNLAIMSRTNPASVFYRSNPNSQSAVSAEGDATANLFSMRLDEFNRLLLDNTLLLDDLPALSDGRSWRIALDRTPIAKPASGMALTGSAGGRWQLVLTHRDGSLDQAVANLRLKNLLISFGVLLLLTVSMLIMIITTRRAQRLAQQKMEFVASISHELRTPLAVICSAGENLADGVVADQQRARQYGAVIHNEGRRLAEMVDQALEFAGAQSGRKSFAPRPVEVCELVDRAIAACAPQISESGFVIDTHLPPALPPVLADLPELSRALQNLIRNALKYGGDQRWIEIYAQVQPIGLAAEVALTVRDGGIGIAPADLPHIFEPFYRGRAVVAAQIHGSGLGLSLVRQILEGHGGRVKVRSVLGSGSAFTIVLPCAPAESRQPANEARAARPNALPDA